MLALSIICGSSTALALAPRCSSSGPNRPSLVKPASRPSLRRSTTVRLALDPSGSDPADKTTTPEPAQQAWPEPAFSVAELQAKENEAIEAAEAATRATAVPLTTEGGTFSYVALTTVLVFFVGGFLFFQGVSGAGMTKFADDQSPEVQACIKQATTRNEANVCLLYVDKD